jgi:hypothetical protein
LFPEYTYTWNGCGEAKPPPYASSIGEEEESDGGRRSPHAWRQNWKCVDLCWKGDDVSVSDFCTDVTEVKKEVE